MAPPSYTLGSCRSQPAQVPRQAKLPGVDVGVEAPWSVGGTGARDSLLVGALFRAGGSRDVFVRFVLRQDLKHIQGV